MYYCPFCVETLTTLNLLKAHCKLKHYKKSVSTFTCRQGPCSRQFSDIYSFFKHLSRRHIEKKCLETPEIEYKKPDMSEDISHRTIESPSSTQSIDISENENSHYDQDFSNISVDQFGDNITKAFASFVANLYANSSLTRSFVLENIRSVQHLFKCVKLLREKYQVTSLHADPDLITMFEIVENAFKDYSSEYHILQNFTNMNCLIQPEEVPINMTFNPKLINHSRQMCATYQKICIIPLKKLFKNFLELPGVYRLLLSYMEKSKERNSITNLLQGKLWHSIEQNYENVVLPLILYFDDLEINNPLGTHRGKHKLGVVYCSIACIPEEYSSQLENIFLVQLHKSEHHKECGNNLIFSNIIEQIKELETDGIIISTENSTKKVNFALLHIFGDNLGLNTILGFRTGFNSSYSCRICLADKTTLHSQVVEDFKLIRTVESYSIDVTNCSKGVHEECVFNSIPNFHVLNNISFDPMHDIFEGICRYDLGKILQMFIIDQKLFSLETLNHRIRYFDYGSQDSKNVPTLITLDALKKGYIIYSAAEMACFLYYLGLLIGDLIPKNNHIWKIYILLRKMVSIILCQKVTNENIESLSKLMTEHHKLYRKIFNDNLKYKHHVLLHYPRAMRLTGPIRNMSCIRFEAKHKEIKASAKVVTSRSNPPYTLALKQQLLLNNRFISQKGFCKRIDMGITLYDNLANIDIFDNFKTVMPSELINRVKCVSWITVNGTKYKPNMIIRVDDSDHNFGKIQFILIDDKYNAYFIYKVMNTERFVEHYYAYMVTVSNLWGFVSQTELVEYAPLNIHLSATSASYVPKIP